MTDLPPPVEFTVPDILPHLRAKIQGLKTAAEIEGDTHRVEERLTRRFGLGQEPAARRNLYRWLGKLANKHGEPVLEAISEACAASDGARYPDRCFCAVVIKLMKKLGFGRTTGGNRQW